MQYAAIIIYSYIIIYLKDFLNMFGNNVNGVNMSSNKSVPLILRENKIHIRIPERSTEISNSSLLICCAALS